MDPFLSRVIYACVIGLYLNFYNGPFDSTATFLVFCWILSSPKMHLDQLLRYENGRKLFMEFLRKEFSEENLEFWLECQRLKNMITIDDKSVGI